MRILSAERLRFPGAGSSAQGKSGPKARPRGVVDGQQVEIPVLRLIVKSEGGTQEAKNAWCWIHVQALRTQVREMLTERGQGVKRSEQSSEGSDVTLPRKASSQRERTRTANRHR